MNKKIVKGMLTALTVTITLGAMVSKTEASVTNNHKTIVITEDIFESGSIRTQVDTQYKYIQNIKETTSRDVDIDYIINMNGDTAHVIENDGDDTVVIYLVSDNEERYNTDTMDTIITTILSEIEGVESFTIQGRQTSNIYNDDISYRKLTNISISDITNRIPNTYNIVNQVNYQNDIYSVEYSLNDSEVEENENTAFDESIYDSNNENINLEKTEKKKNTFTRIIEIIEKIFKK